jgi:hypothetical protein
VQVGDITASFALYTVPGQEMYKDIRLTVLRGVDGVVFVADAQEHRLGENVEFFNLLKKDILRAGKDTKMCLWLYNTTKWICQMPYLLKCWRRK